MTMVRFCLGLIGLLVLTFGLDLKVASVYRFELSTSNCEYFSIP